MNLESDFQHTHAAHCESGVTSNLLKNSGYDIDESYAFGIGSGLFFVHLPFLKVMELPLTSYRSFPGSIFKKSCSRLKIPFQYRTFKDQYSGTKKLEEYADQKKAVGLRANIYWLPYIPEGFRFQFNAHNLVVYGRNSEGEFQVSDPVMEGTSLCSSHALLRARFSKGPLAPKGLIFYPEGNQHSTSDLKSDILKKAIHSGIRETVHAMLFTPLPFAGVSGIKFLAKQMKKWPQKLKDPNKLKLYLSNVVRMQEEIGTGGAGFRYLYAAFLQKAGQQFDHPALLSASKNYVDAGNHWREFATQSVQFCKDRLDGSYDQIPDKLLKIYDIEKGILKDLRGNYL